MITIGDRNSSFSVEYITFECKVCGSQHISFERDEKYQTYKLPSTITTSPNPRTKRFDPYLRKETYEWCFHCLECSDKLDHILSFKEKCDEALVQDMWAIWTIVLGKANEVQIK